jgi:Na+/melibiose symporter-like transporter
MLGTYFWPILAFLLAGMYTTIVFYVFGRKRPKIGIASYMFVFMLWPVVWGMVGYITIRDIRRTRKNINRIKQELNKHKI